jgi:hypothetical protein
MTTPAATARPAWVWVDRTRFAIAVALLWAALHLIPGLLLPGGHDRPLVFASSAAGLVAGVITIFVIWCGAAFATTITGATSVRVPLLAVGFALALWAGEGGRVHGTMGSWLIQQNPQPGPPRGAPYVLLLLDYALLMVAIGGAFAFAAVFAARARGTSGSFTALLRQETASWGDPARRSAGIRATLLTAVVASAAVFLLSGRFLDETYRLQVYFAVWVGIMVGVHAARYVLHVHDPLWYVPVPFVVGVFGLVIAALRPGLLLPAGFHTDIIPAWGLARALPVEMAGIGLVGSLWILRPGRAEETLSAP